MVLIVAGIFVTVGFKLAPAYADHETLKSMMSEVVQDRALLSKRNREIEINIGRRMRINNTVLPKEFLKIVRDKGTVRLIIDYEVRIPIFANVDAVVYFDETYEGQELE
ncbi:hypothetical protein BGP75_07580 [Motiliproteus sp. MSK22-1]|nr:hypothetical protein BGP75_07580 [Motiliproteus sp. MSK22-1]